MSMKSTFSGVRAILIGLIVGGLAIDTSSAGRWLRCQPQCVVTYSECAPCPSAWTPCPPPERPCGIPVPDCSGSGCTEDVEATHEHSTQPLPGGSHQSIPQDSVLDPLPEVPEEWNDSADEMVEAPLEATPLIQVEESPELEAALETPPATGEVLPVEAIEEAIEMEEAVEEEFELPTEAFSEEPVPDAPVEEAVESVTEAAPIADDVFDFGEPAAEETVEEAVADPQTEEAADDFGLDFAEPEADKPAAEGTAPQEDIEDAFDFGAMESEDVTEDPALTADPDADTAPIADADALEFESADDNAGDTDSLDFLEESPDQPSEESGDEFELDFGEEAAPEESMDDADALLDDLNTSTQRSATPRFVSVRHLDLPNRYWTDDSRQYHAVAQLHEIGATHVRLLKQGGTTTTVPLNRLSRLDLAYIRAIQAKQTISVSGLAAR